MAQSRGINWGNVSFGGGSGAASGATTGAGLAAMGATGGMVNPLTLALIQGGLGVLGGLFGGGDDAPERTSYLSPANGDRPFRETDPRVTRLTATRGVNELGAALAERLSNPVKVKTIVPNASGMTPDPAASNPSQLERPGLHLNLANLFPRTPEVQGNPDVDPTKLRKRTPQAWQVGKAVPGAVRRSV